MIDIDQVTQDGLLASSGKLSEEYLDKDSMLRSSNMLYKQFKHGIARAEAEIYRNNTLVTIIRDEFVDISCCALSDNDYWRSVFGNMLESTEVDILSLLESGGTSKLMSQYENNLFHALDEQALESGYSHSSERIIEGAIRELGENATGWFKTIVQNKVKGVNAADVLRLLGRRENLFSVEWRCSIIREALESPDVDLRDAAIEAVEVWRDNEFVPILSKHIEPVGWLSDYIKKVLSELADS